jgi:hypothetical protein
VRVTFLIILMILRNRIWFKGWTVEDTIGKTMSYDKAEIFCLSHTSNLIGTKGSANQMIDRSR